MAEGAEDRWWSGDVYEPYVGRWSRLAAHELLAWLDAPAGLDWLDVGRGTGALAEAVVESRAAPKRIAGIDPSAGFLDFARRRLGGTGAELRQADAQALPFAAAEFDRVVSGLALNFVPDQPRAAAEMARVARPGGEVALYVRDYAGGMEMMRRFWDAAVALDPRAAALDKGARFPVCRPGPLRALFEGAGLTRVETRAIDVPTVFRDFDDYWWTPFLGGAGAGAGLLHVAREGGPRRAARAVARVPARAAGRRHPPRRAGLGRARPQGLKRLFRTPAATRAVTPRVRTPPPRGPRPPGRSSSPASG